MRELRVGDKVVMTTTDCAYGCNGTMEGWFRDRTVLEVINLPRRSKVRAGDGDRIYSFGRGELSLVGAEKKEKAAPKKTPTPATLIRRAKDLILSERDSGENGEAIIVSPSRQLRIKTGPCHGFIRNDGREDDVAIVSRFIRETGSRSHHQKKLPSNVLGDYLDWLMNRSPWAGMFMYKSAANAINEKSVVLRTDVPANLLQGALISTRNTWEYYPHILLWHHLCSKGLDERLAFAMSFFVSIDLNTKKVRVQGMSPDHVAISSHNMTKQGLTAFLAGEPLFVQGEYRKRGCFEGVHKAWNGKGEPLITALRTLFREHGRESVCFNPFVKARPLSADGQREMSFDEYAEFLSRNQDKFTKEEK